MNTEARYASTQVEALADEPASGGMFGWYKHTTPSEKRAFWSCKIGYGLDAMDTQFLSFVIPTLIATWGLSKGEAGLIGTVTLLTSALGGWVAGILSDRIGRVKTLQITILWFAFFTLVCAFAQNYSQLLVARGLMGFGFGGEWTAGAVLIGEVIRPRDRGKAVGMVQAGWAIGWAVAAGLYTLVFSFLPGDIAWRALFALGILPAPFVILIRRLVDEPEVHKQQKQLELETNDRSSFLEIFGPGIWLTTLRTAILATGTQGGRHHHVAADLPEDRAAPERGRHGRLSRRGYRRIVCGLSVRRVSQRPLRQKAEFHRIRVCFDDHRARLYPRADEQRPAACPRLPARLLCIGNLCGDGCVHDRTVPHAHSRLWSGLLLQLWPCSRRDLSVPDWLCRAEDVAGHRDWNVRGNCVWRCHSGRADVAGNTWHETHILSHPF